LGAHVELTSDADQLLLVLLHVSIEVRLAGHKYLGDAAAIGDRKTIQSESTLPAAHLGLADANRHERRRGLIVQEGVHLFGAERLRDQVGDMVHCRLDRRRLYLEQSLEHGQ